MMKYILAATVLIYIVLIFIPKMKITVNGQPSDNFFYRIFSAAVLALIFFVVIGLPIYAVSLLF